MQSLNPLLALMIKDLFHLLGPVICTSPKGVIVGMLIELNYSINTNPTNFGNL